MNVSNDRRKRSGARLSGGRERRRGDRRRGRRVAAEILVEVATRGRRTYRRTANISAGGLAFHQPIPHGRGTRMQLALRLAGQRRPLMVTGEVVGTTPDGRGNRLRFVELVPKVRRALEVHLELFQQPTRIGPPPLVPGGPQGQVRKVLEGIIIVEDDPDAREFRLRSSDKLIGRDRRMVDFVLDHPSVSRRHAHIICHQGRHIINDLSSTNGIHFRGRPVRSLVLRDGMVFRVGRVRLQYLVTREV